MAMRILKPLVRWGGYYPSKKYTPLVYPGGYTTMDAAIGPLDPLNTFSGDIVRFTTKRGLPIQSLKVNMSPKQDLHGYDSPWPAGGGEQLIPFPYKEGSETIGNTTFTVSDNGVIHISGTSNSYSTYFNLYGDSSTPIPDWMTPNTQYYFSPAAVTGKYFCQVIFYGNPSKTFNGGASFTSPADFSSYTGFAIVIGVYSTAGDLNYDVKVMLKKGSSASPWQPYSNICPISGWTGCEVMRTGANVLDDSGMEVLPNNLMIARNEGRGGEPFLLKGGCTYTLSCNSAGTVDAIYFIKSYSSANDPLAYQFGGKSLTYTPTKDTMAGCVFYWANGRPEDATHIMLNAGSTALPYEPYKGNSYSVTWEDEVYGATPDIVSGDMPVTKNLITIGSLSWDYYNGLFYANVVGKANNNASTNIICSVYAQGSRNATGAGDAASILQDKQITGFYDPNSANSWVYVKDSAYATVLAFKTAMRDQTICYELATPVETTITPTPITALKGYNAIWADAGPVEVTAYGTPIVEPNVPTRQALTLLLGGAYRNDQTEDDVSDEEALDIILGGADR